MIDFTRFKIRDMETGTVLFEITKPPVPGMGYVETTVLNSTDIRCMYCGMSYMLVMSLIKTLRQGR